LVTIAAQTQVPSRPEKVALLIGNDHYKYVTPLETAVNDARAIEIVLHDRYGFETTLLTDASRGQILAALSLYRRTLNSESSLLIYYAGHGYSDKLVDKTYWWPVKAQPDDVSEWISADDISTSLKAIPARHILIISDSCFPGTLLRGITILRNAVSGTERERTLTKLRERRSRELLASGGDEPVADGGAGAHSIFAAAFLRALQAADQPEFAVGDIFAGVVASVSEFKQLPRFAPL
jgi:uncharacterized caspase-like protein